MSPLIVPGLSFLLFIQFVLSGSVQNRQDTSPSSISIPAFTYGYYSQLYPNGETAASTTSTVTASTTSLATASNDQPSGTTTASESQEEEFIASMCQPVNQTKQPDMNFPCNKIRLYEYSCVYGLSYQELLQHGGSDSVAPPTHGPKDQRGCFCADEGPGPQYWQNSIDCSECRRLHGASAANIEDYAPVPYIKAFSSAYCAQPSSSPVALFDYATMWTSTASIELGTTTGGTDVLGT